MPIYLQDLQATLACGYSLLLTSILSVWVEENKYLCKLDVADQFLASNLRSKKLNFTLIVFVPGTFFYWHINGQYTYV